MAHSDRWRTMIGGWEAGGMGGEAQNSVPGKEFSSWHTELSPGDIELRPRGTELNPGGIELSPRHTELSAKARNTIKKLFSRLSTWVRVTLAGKGLSELGPATRVS